MIEKKKNKFFIPLLISVIAVWGIIAVRVVEALFTKDDEFVIEDVIAKTPTKLKIDEIAKHEKVILQYEKLDFDPFARIGYTPKPAPVKKTKPVKKKPTQKQNKEKLNYAINGIIINPNSRMIILEDKSSNTTNFLHEGETYKSIKIVKIESNKITYQHEDEVKEYFIK